MPVSHCRHHITSYFQSLIHFIFSLLAKSQAHRSKSSLDVATQLKYKEMFCADVALLADWTPQYDLNKRCAYFSDTVPYVTYGPTLNGASVAGASLVRASIVLLLLTVNVKVNMPEGSVGWNRGVAPLILVNVTPQPTFSREKRPCTDCRHSTVDPTPRGGAWGWQVGRPPQAPILRGPCASGLWVCQAIFSGKLEMLIHAPFKILLQGQIP